MSDDFFGQSFSSPPKQSASLRPRGAAARRPPPPPPPGRRPPAAAAGSGTGGTTASAPAPRAAPPPPQQQQRPRRPAATSASSAAAGAGAPTTITSRPAARAPQATSRPVPTAARTAPSTSRPVGSYYGSTTATSSTSSNSNNNSNYYGMNNNNSNPSTTTTNSNDGFDWGNPAPAPAAAPSNSNQWSAPSSAAAAATKSSNDDWFSSSTNTTNNAAQPRPGKFGVTYGASNNSLTNSNSAESLGNYSLEGAMDDGGQQQQQQPSTFNPQQYAAASSQMKTSSNNAVGDFIDYDNEPPLLEELGIHTDNIIAKTKAVIIPSKRLGGHAHLSPQVIVQDADLAGPIAFCLLLGGEMVLTGKLQFGYIYGFALFGCVSMTLVVNLMSVEPISIWTVSSILGYSLLPVNILACVKIFVMNLINLQRLGRFLGLLTVLWSTTASTRLLELGCGLRDQRYLIAYPLALLYSAFVLITIF